MSAKFYDQNNNKNPRNGTILADGKAAKALLRTAVAETSFVELASSSETKLLIGLGPEICSAQFSSLNGEPPYLFAKLQSESKREGVAEFVIGVEPTEILRRLCIPYSALLEVAAYFVETGERSSIVEWEEV